MRSILSFLSTLVVLLWSNASLAHVKWFTRASMDQAPLSPENLNHFNFWFLFGLSVFTVGLFVYADVKFEKWKAYKKFDKYLETFSKNSVLILRIFTGASLLLSWQADSMIAPELKITHPALGWMQFFIALLLLGRITTSIAGAGMIALYFIAMGEYGFFHLLDYLVYLAIGYFLLVSNFENPKIRFSRIPALYFGLGFSLCWAALEKVFFPTWGLDVLNQQPALTMGLPADFFLLSCAFIELSLGYLLIIGLLQRPLALTVTLVFFTTTAFFGKPELIGHTILHGALLVFIVVGPGGYYARPIDFHKKLWLRAGFAAVNFVIVALILGFLYWKLSPHAHG